LVTNVINDNKLVLLEIPIGTEVNENLVQTLKEYFK